MSLISKESSLRAGSRLGFMREMRGASGEAARAWGEMGPRSRGFATRVSHLAHKTQTRACSQAKKRGIPSSRFVSGRFAVNVG